MLNCHIVECHHDPIYSLMQVFHWSRPVGNYVFFESRDQCLQGWLGSVVVSRYVGRVGEISNKFDISTTVPNPCNRP